MPNPTNKIIFTKEMQQFLKDNYKTKTNRELADALGLNLTTTRKQLYSLGLKRMEMEYWTAEQTQFLKDNYKTFGDTELAEIFEVKWYKAKGWDKKHIEKKRRYLSLKRTLAEKNAIRVRNTKMGRFAMCAKKRWETIGEAPIGEKRIWFHKNNAPFVVIKTKSGFVYYSRWLWQKERGKIPVGMVVRIVGSDKINFTIKDLKLITKAENAALNSKERLPPELRKLNELSKKLNRIISKAT